MRIGNVLTIVLTITIALATPASAQVDAMWDGSTLDTFWLTGDNWTGGIAPNAALDIARFDDTGVMGVVDMNGNALTVFDMYLSGAASGYDISNGTLTATNVYHSATGTNTISGAVSLGGIGVFTVSGGRLNLTNPASSITGLTLITGGALDIGDLSVNSNILAGSFIKFQLASEESGGIVIARGTGANKFARNIGSADGDVRWYANGGGFAARGGPLELLLEGGRLLDWGSSSYGFGRKTIAFGHAVADDVVTLLNDVEVDRDCNVIVFDNHDTDTDIAEFRGTLVPSTIVGKWLIKRATENDAAAYGQSGTLWLSNAANNYDNTRIQAGAIRLTQNDDGLGTGYLQFYADRHDQPAVLESKGTFDRTIGTALGQIHWATDLSLDLTGEGRGGGFAAYGGPLTVTLHPNSAPGTTNLLWDSELDGFNGTRLQLGSYSANDVVTFASNIDAQNGDREIWVYDNPHQTTDRAVISGSLTNLNELAIRGGGSLEISSELNVSKRINVYEGTLSVSGDTNILGTEDDDGIFIYAGAKFQSGGNVLAGDEIRVHDGAAIGAGNSVGTMNVTFKASGDDRWLWFEDGDFGAGDPGGIYEWEIGGRTGSIVGDLISVDSSAATGLFFEGDWTFRIVDPDTTGVNVMQHAGDLKVFEYSSTNFSSGRVRIVSDKFGDAGWPADASGLSLYNDFSGGIWLSGLVVSETYDSILNDDADGNWKSAGTWLPAEIPTAAVLAIVDSNTVTVAASDAEAGMVEVSGGTLDINGTLTISSVIDVSAGILNVNGGGRLNTGGILKTGGAINIDGTLDAPAVSTADMTIGAGATLDVADLTVNSAEDATAFTLVDPSSSLTITPAGNLTRNGAYSSPNGLLTIGGVLGAGTTDITVRNLTMTDNASYTVDPGEAITVSDTLTVTDSSTLTISDGSTPTISKVNVIGGQLNTTAMTPGNFTVGPLGAAQATGAIAATGDVTVAGSMTTNSNVTAAGNVTITGSMSTSSDVTATGELILDGSTVNVSGVAVFTGTGSTVIENTPDLNITSGGDLTISVGAGGGYSDYTAVWDFEGADDAERLADKSGNGYNLVRQAVGPNPVTPSAGANGYNPELLGDSAFRWFGDFNPQIGTPTNGGFSIPISAYSGGDYTFVVLARAESIDNGTGRHKTILDPKGGAHDGMRFQIAPAGYGNNAYNWNVEGSGWQPKMDEDLWHVVLFEYDSTIGYTAFDNNSDVGNPFTAEATRAWTGAPGTTEFYIGTQGGQSDAFHGEFAFALFHDGMLTPAQQADLLDMINNGGAGDFGDLTMAAGTHLRLDDGKGAPGAGEAGFQSISGQGTIHGETTAIGAVNPTGTIVVEGDFIATADSNTTWGIGDLIDVNAGVGMAGDLTLEDGFTLTIDEASTPTFGLAYPVFEFEGALMFGRTPAGLPGPVTNGVVNNVGGGDWGSTSMWYNSSSVFLVASADRTWNGSVGNWSSSNWLPGAPSGPTQFGNMIVNSGTVTVDAPYTGMSGALTLAVGGGTVEVASNLDVATATTVSSGALNVDATMQSGSIAVSGGSVTARAGGTLISHSTLDVTAGAVNVEGSDAGTRGHLQAPTVNSAGTLNVNGFGKVTAGTVNVTGGTASFGPDNELAIDKLNISGATVSTDGMVTGGELNFNSGELIVTGNVTTTGELVLTGGTVTKLGGGLSVLSSDAKLKAKGSNLDIQNGQLQINVPAGSTPDGLIARWSFEAGVGTTVADSSGRGFDGNIIGNVTWVDDPDRGTVLEFAGADGDYITVPNAAALFASLGVTEEVTVSLWQRDAIGSRTNSLFNGRVDGRRALHAHVPWNNSRVYWDAGDSYDRIEKDATPDDYNNKWNHWAFTKNMGEMKIFLNGVEWHSGTGKNRSIAGINEFWIGEEPAFNYLGKMDEFSIYDQVLSAEDIAALAGDEFLARFGDLTMSNSTELIMPKVLGEGGAASFGSIVAGDNTTITGSPVTGSFVGGNNVLITGDPIFTGPATMGTGAVITGIATIEAGGRFAPTGGATITGDLVVNGTITPAGGEGGTLAVSDNMVMGDGSNYEWVTDGSSTDTVTVGSELDLSNPFNVILQPGGVVDTAIDYDLFTYGTLVGIPRDNFTLVPDGPYAELLDMDPASSLVFDDAGTIKLRLTGTVDTAVWNDTVNNAWAPNTNWDGLTTPSGTVAAIVNSSANFDATVTVDATAHTLIIDKAPGAVVGGKVVVNAPGATLTIDNNTHVMTGATLDVQSGTFHGVGDTTVYDGGAISVTAGEFRSGGNTTVRDGGGLDVQGSLVLSDEKNLVTAGTTTFGAAASLSLNVIGGLPEDVKGNLNITGGATTIADGATFGVHAINATGGTLNTDSGLGGLAALNVDDDGTVVSTAPLAVGNLSIGGAGSVTAPGIAVPGELSLGDDGLLNTPGDVSGDIVILKGGGTLMKTTASSAAVSAITGIELKGVNVNVAEGSLTIPVPESPPPKGEYKILLLDGNINSPRTASLNMETELLARTDAVFTVERRNAGDPVPVDFEQEYDAVIGLGQAGTAQVKYGDLAVPFMTAGWDQIMVALDWLDTNPAWQGINNLDIVDASHPVAGGLAAGNHVVWTQAPMVVLQAPGLAPSATVVAASGGMPSIWVFEEGDLLHNGKIAPATQIGTYWSNSYEGPNLTPEAQAIFHAQVDYLVQAATAWLGEVTLGDNAALNLSDTGSIAMRSIESGVDSTINGDVFVRVDLNPVVDGAGTLTINGDMAAGGSFVYTWDDPADVVNVTGKLTLADNWTLKPMRPDGAPAALPATPYKLFSYGTLDAIQPGGILTGANIDLSEVPGWAVSDPDDIFVINNSTAGELYLYIAPTLTWDHASQAIGDYVDANWIGGPGLKNLGNMIIPDGEVTVRGTYADMASALSVAVTGTLNIAPGGDLSVARGIDVSGTGELNVNNTGVLSASTLNLSATANVSGNLTANTANVSGGGLTIAAGGTLEVTDNADVTAAGTVNVDGTMNVGTDLNLVDGAVSVSTTGTASITGEVNVDADGNLTVLAGGGLNVTTVNTTGRMNLTDVSGVIDTINATGGTLHTAGSTITNLNVNGATVNTPGGSGITNLNARNGQVNVTDRDLSVATASLRPGVMDASVNSLVVTESVLLGGMEISVTGGEFKLTGADPANHDLARTLTLNGGVITTGGGGSGIMIAGDLVVELDAQDLTPGAVTEWANSEGSLGGVFTSTGDPQVTTIDDGTIEAQGVTLDGNGDWFQGPLAPDSLEGNNPRSVEVWTYNPATGGEETMAAWAHRGGPDGSNVSFNFHGDASWGAVGHWGGSADIGWDGVPSFGVWHHLVYTQSGSHTKVYADGVLKNEEVVGISSHADNPIRIGAQNESQGGGNATQQYSGSIAQIRIHAGVLSPEDILANYDAGIEASSSGGDPDLSKTTIVAAADSTLAVATEPGQPVVLGDVEVADGVALSIGDAVNVEITNLTLGAGSIAKSSLAAPVTGTSDATITIKGRFTGGDNSAIGDTGDEFGIGSDWYFTNLTLAGTSTFEWTFTSGALDVDLDFDGEDDLAAGDSLEVFGAVNLEDGVKIQLVAGGGSSAAGGVDVALFWAIDGATWDPSKVTVKPPPDHLDWTWETDGLGYPVLEYVNDEWVVLKGLVAPGDTPESHPGDANGDDRVNEVDLAILNDQWGLRAPDQSCDFDGDGDVDIDDFNILKVNMGWDGTGGGAPQATASETPEPCSAVLMLLGLGAVIRRRRKCQDR